MNQVTFIVTNTGQRADKETAQVYATLPFIARHAPQQWVGWANVSLEPGQAKTLSGKREPILQSVFDAHARHWRQPKGRYEIHVGASSRDTPVTATFTVR